MLYERGDPAGRSEGKRERSQGKKENQGKGMHFTRCAANNSGMVGISKEAVWDLSLGLIITSLGLKKTVPQLKGNVCSKFSKHTLNMAFFLL